MTGDRTAVRPRNVRVWVRAPAAVVAALGTYCLTYHLVFYSLWRFFFGEEVWPWPRWSLYILVGLPTILALVSGGFYILARVTKRAAWIAVGIGALSLFGLLRYAAEVFKVMIQLGFRP